MKTRQTNIRRHEFKVTGFPMQASELVTEIRKVQEVARQHEPESLLIGFQHGVMALMGDALILQWDEVLPDEKADDDANTEGEGKTA